MKPRWRPELPNKRYKRAVRLHATDHEAEDIAIEMKRGPKCLWRWSVPQPYQWDEDLPTEGVHQLAVLLAALSFAGDSSSNVIAQAVKKLEAHLVQEEDRMAAVARMRAHARALRAAAEHKRRYLVDFLRHVGIQVPEYATHKEATQFVKVYAHLVSFHVRMSCLSPMARAYLAESELFRKYGIRE